MGKRPPKPKSKSGGPTHYPQGYVQFRARLSKIVRELIPSSVLEKHSSLYAFARERYEDGGKQGPSFWILWQAAKKAGIDPNQFLPRPNDGGPSESEPKSRDCDPAMEMAKLLAYRAMLEAGQTDIDPNLLTSFAKVFLLHPELLTSPEGRERAYKESSGLVIDLVRNINIPRR